MKNGKLVSDHLDECAKIDELKAAGEDYIEQMSPDTPFGRSWFACLENGWTVEELDAAYERRFKRGITRKAI